MLVAALVLAAASPVHLTLPVDAPPRAVSAAARAMLRDPAWLEEDPDLAFADDVAVTAQRFGQRVVIRAVPTIDGVRVDGADRVLIVDGGSLRRPRHLAPLIPHGAFAIDGARALDTACSAVSGCLFTDTTVEDLQGFAAKTWLARADGIYAAWRVRIPTLDLRAMRDVWIDADTGGVLKSAPSVVFAAPTPAKTFHNDQPTSPDADLVSELEDVQLEELLPLAVGDHLRGEHFETFNCCKHFICNDASADCLKNLPSDVNPNTVATCAQATDAGANVSTVDLAVPSSVIPFPIPGIGDTLFARVAFCAELPRVVSRAADGTNPDGWFETPVDKDRTEDNLAGLAAEEDAFAEVQVYHSTYVFFQHVRDVLQDPSFCLGPNSMQCETDGTSSHDANGEPVHAFHITTNVLFPALDLNALGQQILAGHGRTAEDPVVISDYQRVPNAAFVPALSGGPINIPPELQVLASLFNRPFDSNVYFQGERDFAYDGDVVHHEFTHGVVHALNADLASVGFDEYGTHVEPGALNEGWADIMSSSFIGNSSVGEYASDGLTAAGETGLRDNNNTKKCPDDIIGEVHADSEPWAGALWATRDTLGGDADKIKALERAVLAGVAASDPNEDFAKASASVVDAIKAEATLGQTVADVAQAQLDTRGLSGCVRVLALTTLNDAGDDIVQHNKDTLIQLGKTDVGLGNFAPAVMQFKVAVPPKSGGFTLTWDQSAGGLGLGGGGAPAPMLVIAQEITGNDAGIIHWTYEGAGGATAVPHDDAGAPITFDANADANKATIGAADGAGISKASFTQTLDSSCDTRTFIVQILAPDAGANFTNLSVANTATDLSCAAAEGEGEGSTPPPDCGCQGIGDATPLAGLALLLFTTLRRRRRA